MDGSAKAPFLFHFWIGRAHPGQYGAPGTRGPPQYEQNPASPFGASVGRQVADFGLEGLRTRPYKAIPAPIIAT